MRYCGAKNRSGKTCKNPPLKNGNGRCRMHGGKTPNGPDSVHFKHGRYAEVFKGKLAERFMQAQTDSKPLDLLPELYVQRSLLAHYIETVSKTDKPTIKDLKQVSLLAEDVVKTAATIAKVRNETALTIAEIRFIQNSMLKLMEKYVPDPNERRSFIEDIRGLLPSNTDAQDTDQALPTGTEAAVSIT